MKVNGFLIREAIRRWELRRDSAAGLFKGSLFRFSGEIKTSPVEISDRFVAAEAATASLQTSQARYNLLVTVVVFDQEMTLAESIKRIGGAGRLEKMWRDAAAPKQDKYGYERDLMERELDKERSVPVLGEKELMDRAHKAAAFAGAIRAAIASGNGTMVEHSDVSLDSSLLTE